MIGSEISWRNRRLEAQQMKTTKMQAMRWGTRRVIENRLAALHAGYENGGGVRSMGRVCLGTGKEYAGNMSDATVMLAAIERGDQNTAERLLVLVYDELRRLAASKLAHEAPGQTLQPTALVHEAWMRLIGDQTPSF